MLKYYPYAILAVAALQLLAIVSFFRYVLELSGARSWFAGALFYAVLVTSMPSPQNGIYWFTGSVEYQLTATTALALFTFVRAAPDKLWSNALICLAIIMTCGQHELTAFCVFVAFAGVSATSGFAVRESRWRSGPCRNTSSAASLPGCPRRWASATPSWMTGPQ